MSDTGPMSNTRRIATATGFSAFAVIAIVLAIPFFGSEMGETRVFGLPAGQTLAMHGALVLFGLIVFLFATRLDRLAANEPVEDS